MKIATHGAIRRITRRKSSGGCFYNPMLIIFKHLMGTPCSKVENTDMALDQRAIFKICSKKPNICRFLKSFSRGPLEGTTVSKAALQFFTETKTILLGTNAK